MKHCQTTKGQDGNCKESTPISTQIIIDEGGDFVPTGHGGLTTRTSDRLPPPRQGRDTFVSA